MFQNEVLQQSHDGARAGPPPPSDSGKSRMLGVNVNYLDVFVSSQLLLSESLTGKSKCVNIYVPVLRETTVSPCTAAVRSFSGLHTMLSLRRKCARASSQEASFGRSFQPVHLRVPHSLSKGTKAWPNLLKCTFSHFRRAEGTR